MGTSNSLHEHVKTDRVYCGDCLGLMRNIPDEAIDLTVTSPPYDDLRNYNGYTFRYEPIITELYRITKRGGGCSLDSQRRNQKRERDGIKF